MRKIPSVGTQKYERYIPNAFDETLSIVEKVNNVIHSQNDVINSNNEVVEVVDNLDKWVRSDGLQETVNNKFEEMEADGTLETLINVGILGDLKDKIDEVETDTNQKVVSLGNSIADVENSIDTVVTEQLVPIESDISDLKVKTVFKQGNTYGTFEQATVESVIANNPEGRAQVLGIPLSDDKALAEYGNRDTVASYRSNTSRPATLNVATATYTRYTCVLPVGTDLSKVKINMIIDTKHEPKFSAFITAIDIPTRTLTVKNWYQLGNSAVGQVPTNGVGLYVDMPTKIWTDNVSVYLEKDDSQPENAGAIAELGMLNNQSDGGNRVGVDVVSLGEYKPEAGFVARGSSPNNIWNIGYLSVNSKDAFVSNNGESGDGSGALLHNTASGFHIRHDGMIPWHRVAQGHSGQGLNLNSKYYTVFIITQAVLHNLPTPSDSEGA